MAKHYRWNKKKFAENLMELATMMATAALIVWLTATWILAA